LSEVAESIVLGGERGLEKEGLDDVEQLQQRVVMIGCAEENAISDSETVTVKRHKLRVFHGLGIVAPLPAVPRRFFAAGVLKYGCRWS
jgi:hypothetical protein